MRITNMIREKIEDALIDHAFSARKKVMRGREADLALKIYRLNVPEALERALDKIAEQTSEAGISGSFFETIGCVKVVRAGMSTRKLALLHRRPWVSEYDSSAPSLKMEDGHELVDEFESFVRDFSALEAEINKSRAEIAGTLAPIYTAKALRAAWPEVMSIADPILVAAGMVPKPQPLVVATENLNVTLGLPAEEMAEAA